MIIAFFIITVFAWLYVKVGILLTREKHLQDRIISIRRDVWVHKTSLTPPLFIEVPVLSLGKWVVMYLCVSVINFTSFYDFDI